LTNNFPSSSRWVVSSNLFNPGRCSVLGVSSSCPSTAATTWYSFLRHAQVTATAVSPPGGGGLGDVFPPWRKSNIRVCPVASLAAGGGGATVPKQEATPRRLSSESTTLAPQRGTRQALTSRLRRRRASFPRNTPTSSGQMTPVRSRRASTKRCAEATTPGVGDATTAGRTGAPHPNHLVSKPSAGPYDGRHSRPGSEPRLPSPSTRGKQGRNCGLRTTGWPAS
jgi:hypothetical protein